MAGPWQPSLPRKRTSVLPRDRPAGPAAGERRSQVQCGDRLHHKSLRFRDYLGLLKTAIVASRIVPPGTRRRHAAAPDARRADTIGSRKSPRHIDRMSPPDGQRLRLQPQPAFAVLTPVGHRYEVSNLLRNGVLFCLLAHHPQLIYLMVHTIDTTGVGVDAVAVKVCIYHGIKSCRKHHSGCSRNWNRIPIKRLPCGAHCKLRAIRSSNYGT